MKQRKREHKRRAQSDSIGEESTKKKAQKRENNLTRKREGDSTGEARERERDIMGCNGISSDKLKG